MKEASGLLQVDILGFQPLDDRGLLTGLLTANGERIGNPDATDRAAKDLRDGD